MIKAKIDIDARLSERDEAETSGENTPIQEDFLHAPNRPGAVLAGENRRLYSLGRMLEEECPDNDCRIYLNIFHMAQEADAALGVLDGYAAQVMARDLRRRLSELWNMYLTNDAIFHYRQGRSGKQTVPPAGHDSPHYPGKYPLPGPQPWDHYSRTGRN